jgi:putative nucleotidyltransferase with HDIG domain
MRRVLFVDDDPDILQGLQLALRKSRSKWHSEFVLGGPAAIQALGQSSFYVIVTELRLRQVDGAALLRHVDQAHPRMVRIILSGHAEAEAALRAVPVTHQFLSKPCDARTLEQVVERACNLQALVGDETVRALVGQIKQLPSVPRVYQALVAVMARPDCTLDDVSATIEQDIVISARLLQVINSAFFGLSQRVSRVRDAVSYLGLNMVKSVVLMSELFSARTDQPAPTRAFVDHLQRHAFLTAALARKLAPDRRTMDDAFMAGLLHDIGKLILISQPPEHFPRAGQVEERFAGVSHAEVGAYLLGIWGLPYSIVEAVADHHHPERIAVPSFDVLTCVHVANALANALEEKRPPVLATSYLQAIGVESRLAEWQRTAEGLAAEIR